MRLAYVLGAMGLLGAAGPILVAPGRSSSSVQVHHDDDVLLSYGNTRAAPDFWCEHDTATTPDEWACSSTDIDGAGADGKVFFVADGTDDLTFLGNIQANNANGPALRNAAGGNTGTAGGLLPDRADTDSVISFSAGAMRFVVDNVAAMAVSSTTITTGGGVYVSFGGAIYGTNPTTGATCADNATPASAPSCTLTSSDVRLVQHVNCQDADGCNFTLDETSVNDGAFLIVVNIGTNTANFPDTPGVQETASPALGQWDAVTFAWASSTWVQLSPVQNN